MNVNRIEEHADEAAVDAGQWQCVSRGLHSVSFQLECRARPIWEREFAPALPLSVAPEDFPWGAEDPRLERRPVKLRTGDRLDLETLYWGVDGWWIRVADWIDVELGATAAETPPGQVYVWLRAPLLRIVGVRAALELAQRYLADLGLETSAPAFTRATLAADFLEGDGRPAARLGQAFASAAEGPPAGHPDWYHCRVGPAGFHLEFGDYRAWTPGSIDVADVTDFQRTAAGPAVSDSVPAERRSRLKRVVCWLRPAEDEGPLPGEAADARGAAMWALRRLGELWRRTLDEGVRVTRPGRGPAHEAVVTAWREQVAGAFDGFAEAA